VIPLRDINPSRTLPLLTGLIILINVIIFVQNYEEGVLFEERIYELGYVPALGFSWERAISSMFMHGGWLHLFFNMWTLWVFGDNVEDRLGKVGYALLYFLSGVGALFLHVALYPSSEVPVVGASGAISGVMGAYLVLFPQARVWTWIPPFYFTELSAKFFLVLWLLIQLTEGIVGRIREWMIEGEASGVAFWAHIGGFVVGWVIARVWPKEGRGEDWKYVG
jgi:membrane associated rhomboid family serine protease